MKFFFTAAIVLSAALILGCGNHPPELNQIYSQLNFIKNPEEDRVLTEFLVLINADDEDGDDDVETVYIFNDKMQIYWTVERGSWSERNNRGLKWYGSQRLSTIDGSPPSPGEYRVVVSDRAGERVGGSVFVPVVENIPGPEDFPVVNFEEDENYIRIESPQNRNILSFYDEKGQLLRSYAVTPGTIDIGNISDGQAVAENYRSIKLSYYSNAYGAGLISGPYVRPES